MKLSIIIPYYETIELTEALLNNLNSQINDNNDVEIIVIDDGCNELKLDKYKNKNFKIIHNETNQGSGRSRNIGIQNSQGQYIGFIDCDDMVSNDYIKELIWGIDNRPADIIVLDWQDMTSGNIMKRPQNFAPWRAIYKKDFFPTFIEDLKYGMEDIYTTAYINNTPHTETYLDKVLYYYNSNRIGSLMWKKKRGL